MLVLTRKREEKITIGNNIVITVLKIQGDKVSLGIEADRDTPVYRSELLTRENPKKKDDGFYNETLETLQIDLEKEKQLTTSNSNNL